MLRRTIQITKNIPIYKRPVNSWRNHVLEKQKMKMEQEKVRLKCEMNNKIINELCEMNHIFSVMLISITMIPVVLLLKSK